MRSQSTHLNDGRADAQTDPGTDTRTWATLNALPHSSNGGGIKINLRVLSKCHAHFQSLTKTPVKFQKDWDNVVGGVALTKHLLQ